MVRTALLVQETSVLTQETKMIMSVEAFITISETKSTRTTYIALESDGYIEDQAGG
jgi:hypothetical protein